MKKVQELNISYVGYAQPETELEIEFECRGLELAVCEIQSRIAKLRQAQQLYKLLEASNEKDK